MSDDALRLAERALAASPDDPSLVDRLIAERRRAGLVVGEDLLDRRVLPARRLAFGVPRPFVTAVAPDGEEAELLGADDLGVDLPAHRSWQGEVWLEWIYVNRCPHVTRAGADDLARALPRCSLTLDDDEVPAPT